ncbi:MAG TPA: histidine kinase [Mycobacteriales bacterium]
MDLSPYVESLRRDLTSAAAAGTEETRRTAELLANALDSAVRLTILDALTTATADVTEALNGVTVDVRMHGREPRIVVTQHEPEPAEAPAPPPDEDGTARITLRLPESVKSRAEDAAGRDGVSVNAWLVRAVQAALDRRSTGARADGRRLTGYARG